MCVPIESYRVAGGPSPPLSDYNSRGASGTRIALQRPCHGAASVGKVAAMFFYGHRDGERLRQWVCKRHQAATFSAVVSETIPSTY